MVLTSVVAIVTSILIRFEVPKIAQGLLSGYLIFLVVWAVLRGPNVLADMKASRMRRRELEHRRAELENEAAELRRRREIADADDKLGGS